MNQSFYPGEDLASLFPLKAALSIFFLALVHHAFMFLCFSLLVLADLLSRWIAISAALLRAEGKSEATLLSMIRAIPRARRLGLICSSVMKEQGLSKLILYNLCVLVSACADYLLSESGFPSAVGYLTAAEALSVMENLSEAGFSSVTFMLKHMKGGRK